MIPSSKTSFRRMPEISLGGAEEQKSRSFHMASNVLSMAPDVSLTRYMQEIRKFPMLAHEEEERLARQCR
jgi:DNA-directed RNA polymerase sigma subunit (sigma70/sigma32)